MAFSPRRVCVRVSVRPAEPVLLSRRRPCGGRVEGRGGGLRWRGRRVRAGQPAAKGRQWRLEPSAARVCVCVCVCVCARARALVGVLVRACVRARCVRVGVSADDTRDSVTGPPLSSCVMSYRMAIARL